MRQNQVVCTQTHGRTKFFVHKHMEEPSFVYTKTHGRTKLCVHKNTWQNQVVFSGLEAMHSYEVRVRAKTAINDNFGEWSTSAYVKLTDSPPLLSATVVDFVVSQYNDRIYVNWTAEANPKQADRCVCVCVCVRDCLVYLYYSCLDSVD